MKKRKSIEMRAEKILRGLSLEEKISLLGGENTGTKEIKGKFPKLKFADGPVGVHWWCEKSTAYPALIALASSFNPELSWKMGRALARDCRARGVHVLLAPGVNIYRSPLCGRNFEYLGEDPFLSGRMAVGYIEGLQSLGVAATVKHYAMNFQEYERHRVSSDSDERTMREIYLPAFEAAVREAKTGAVMTAYNLVNGQHCSENSFLNLDVLKGEWNFGGVIMSDWCSTYSAAGAANGGLDLEMPTAIQMNAEKLMPLIEKGIVTEQTIDDKVRRIIKLALRFGWLDNDQKDDSIPLDDPETAGVALDVAREGIVMLKNKANLLPLKKEKTGKIAVIGYNAGHPVICGGGSAYTPPNHVKTILDGVRDECGGGGMSVEYEIGFDEMRHQKAMNSTVFKTPDGKDGLLGRYHGNNNLEGEPLFERIDAHVDFQWGSRTPDDRLKYNSYSVRWSGKLVATADGPHVFYYRIQDGHSTIRLDGNVIHDSGNSNMVVNYGLQTFHLDLEMGREYDISMEFKSRGGWCVMQFGCEPLSNVEEERRRAVELAKGSDAVVLGVGFTSEKEGEGNDRSFKFGEYTEKLIEEVLDANPATVVCVNAGGGFAMDSWLDKAKAILLLWYPGQEGGTAAAEIIFGKTSPSGRLPISIEKRLEDRSSFGCYHDPDKDLRVQLADGIFCGYRGFGKAGVKPLFPFGFGLSYSKFEYGKLRLSSTRMKRRGKIKATVEIRNAGKFKAAETVMLFIQDTKCSYPRPLKELKGFGKIELGPGESGEVHFKIDFDSLKFFDPDRRKWRAEKGAFKALVGPNAEEIRIAAKFKLD